MRKAVEDGLPYATGLFLGESLSSAGWLGLTCVIAGVAAMTFLARQQAAAV